MIPKIIHYCWFGRGEKSKLAIKCIESWKRICPEYKIIEWNEDNFKCDSLEYTRFTYDYKLYAYLSDYLSRIIRFLLREINIEHEAKSRNKLSLIEVKCSIGARVDLGRPTTTALENKANFADCLK